MLRLAEKVILFALDDETGKIAPLPEQYLDYAISGALLMELALAERLETSEDAEVVILDKTPTGDPVANKVLESLPGTGESLPLEKALAQTSAHAKAYMEDILQGLVDRNILKREDYRYLLIFTKECYPMIDDEEETRVRQRLREILLEGKKPREKDTTLIGITHVCNLLKPLFSDEEWERAEPKIHTLTKDEVMSQTIATSLERIQQAVLFVVTNAG